MNKKHTSKQNTLPDLIKKVSYLETNLLRFQINFLDKAMTGKKGDDAVIDISRKNADGSIARWRVFPDSEFGACGPLDGDAWMAFLKMLSEMPKLDSAEPVKINFCYLCRIMKVPYRMIPYLKISFQRFCGISVKADRIWDFLDDKSRKRSTDLTGKARLGIRKVVFVGEDLGEGKRAERNLVWLDEDFVAIINANRVTPLDDELYFSFRRPSSKALQRWLNEAFFASHKKASVSKSYRNLCSCIILRPWVYKSDAEKQLRPAFDELREKGFISKWQFTDIPGVKGDWKVTIWKGPRWCKFYHARKHTGRPTQPDEDVIDVTPETVTEKAVETPMLPGMTEPAAAQAPEPVQEGVRSQEETADQSAAESVEDADPREPKKAKPVPGADPDVKTFIDYVFQAFQEKTGEKLFIDGGKDGALIKKLLGVYGLEKLKELYGALLSSDDPFIQQSGYSIGVFKSQINKLLVGSNGGYKQGNGNGNGSKAANLEALIAEKKNILKSQYQRLDRAREAGDSDREAKMMAYIASVEHEIQRLENARG